MGKLSPLGSVGALERDSLAPSVAGGYALRVGPWPGLPPWTSSHHRPKGARHQNPHAPTSTMAGPLPLPVPPRPTGPPGIAPRLGPSCPGLRRALLLLSHRAPVLIHAARSWRESQAAPAPMPRLCLAFARPVCTVCTSPGPCVHPRVCPLARAAGAPPRPAGRKEAGAHSQWVRPRRGRASARTLAAGLPATTAQTPCPITLDSHGGPARRCQGRGRICSG